MEFRGTILAKASKTNGVKIDDNWYTMDASGYCAKLEKQQKVYGTYEQTKGKKTILTIFVDGGASTPQTAPATETGFKCEVCGKALKDGKYKKCYDCNQSGAVAPASAPQDKKEPNQPAAQEQGGYSGGSKYGSAEDVAGKEVGCAANCASTMLSGRTEDVDTLAQEFKVLVREVLNTIRELK